MKSSRGRWAQLGGLPGGGGWWSREARSCVNTVRGRLIPSLGGSLKTTKPVCRKLQPTNLRLQTTELQDSKDYRNYKLQNSKLQTCQLTNLQKFPSQPGGPQGAGGYVYVCAWTNMNQRRCIHVWVYMFTRLHE